MTTRIRQPLAIVPFATLVLLAPATDAKAQGTAPAEGRQSGVLEEIVVQAQKRSEPLQQVPIAATALTTVQLESRFIKDFTDVSAALPNASLEAEGLSNYASSFYIRGQGVLNRGPFVDPAVAVVVDGVTEGRVATTLTDFLDIEAIEVLRGPQGTLQGRNATGGAVLVRHFKPDPDAFDGNVGVLVGNAGRRDLSGMLNVPIVAGTAAFRIAAKWTETDGFYTNTFNGQNKDVSGQDRVTVLPSFLWQADSWNLTVRGEYSKYNDGSSTITALNACRVDPRLNSNTPLNDTYINLIAQRFGGAAAVPYCAPAASERSFTINQDRPLEVADLEVTGVSAELNYDIGKAGTVTLVSGYKDNEEVSALDVDGTFAALNFNKERTTHHQFSSELRFASAFSQRFDFVAGLLYLEQGYILDRDTFIGTGPTIAQVNGGSAQDNKQYGAFGQANWHFTDALTLVAGARYTKDEKDFRVCGTAAAECAGRFQFASQSWNNTSPRVGLNFEVNPQTFLYGYWGRGFRAGGFNGEAGSAAAAGPFDPEKVDTYELGAKIDTWDDRLRLNAAVFSTKAEDLQRQLARIAASGVAEIVTQNAAEAEIRGAELEVTALPLRGLTINVSLGYLDGEYTNYCTDLNGIGANDPSLVACAPPIVASNGIIQPVDLTNLPLARTPKWTTRVAGQYEIPIGASNSLILSAEWAHQDEELTLDGGAPVGTNLGITNFDGSRVDPMRPATDIYNGSIMWKGGDGRYTFALYGKNLSNEIYYRRLSFASPTLSFGTLANPREYGGQFSYHFGQ